MTSGATVVTGATGFAGRHLLDRLAGSGAIIAWHRPEGRPADLRRPVQWQAVDLVDRASVRRAIELARPARIFHLAGAPNVATSWENADVHLRTNALGTHYLLDAVAAVASTCRVLIATSGQIYRASPEPIDEHSPLGPSNPYGLSKLAQDDLGRRAAARGMDVEIGRPFNHIGPLQDAGFAISSFARQIARIECGLEPPVLSVGNLDAERDLTDVRDVVAAYEVIMDGAASGSVYNVCSGRTWPIRALLDQLLGQSSKPITVQTDAARFRPNDVPRIQGDFSRLRGALGWTPTIAIEQTLRDTLHWWRSITSR